MEEDQAHNYIRQLSSFAVQMYMFSCTIQVAAAGFVCSNLGKTPFITFVLPFVFSTFAFASGWMYLHKVPKMHDAILEEMNVDNVNYPKGTYFKMAQHFGAVLLMISGCWFFGWLWLIGNAIATPLRLYLGW